MKPKITSRSRNLEKNQETFESARKKIKNFILKDCGFGKFAQKYTKKRYSPQKVVLKTQPIDVPD